jgi:hypothetical protein
MDRELVRREILLLGAARWTMLWEPVVRLNELAPDMGPLELAEFVVDALRSLADRGSIKFVRAGFPGPTAETERRRLGRAQVASALSATAVQVPGDVWFSATRNGERELATLLGVKLAGRRRKSFARVVAGFAMAVQSMVRRRHPRLDRDSDGPLWFGHGSTAMTTQGLRAPASRAGHQIDPAPGPRSPRPSPSTTSS